MTESQLTAFLECTRRFDKIMESFPPEARLTATGALHALDLKKQEHEYKIAIVRLFNLLSEEYYLVQNDVIQSDVWNLWLRHAASLLKVKVFASIWAAIKDEYDPAFVAAVEAASM